MPPIVYLGIFQDTTILSYDRKEAIAWTKNPEYLRDNYLLRVDAMFPALMDTQYCQATVVVWTKEKPNEYNPYV